MVSSRWPKSRGAYRTTRFGNTATWVGQMWLPLVKREARKTGTSFVKARLRRWFTAQGRTPRPTAPATAMVMGSTFLSGGAATRMPAWVRRFCLSTPVLRDSLFYKPRWFHSTDHGRRAGGGGRPRGAAGAQSLLFSQAWILLILLTPPSVLLFGTSSPQTPAPANGSDSPSRICVGPALSWLPGCGQPPHWGPARRRR